MSYITFLWRLGIMDDEKLAFMQWFFENKASTCIVSIGQMLTDTISRKCGKVLLEERRFYKSEICLLSDMRS